MITVASAEKLQNALDKAENNDFIYFTNDITGDVVATQKADVKVTINGQNKKFEGVMNVFGNGRQSGAETLTIKNINFVAKNGAESCIVSPGSGAYGKYSYAHNVTVEGCTFTDPDGDVNCTAIRQSTAGDMNWTVKNCIIDSTMHSLSQIKNIAGKLIIEGCEVYSKNGVSLNNCLDVEMTKCTFDVKGYAVRFGDSKGGTVTGAKAIITGSTLTSQCEDGDAVIMFRNTSIDATLTLTGTTMVGNISFSGNEAVNATIIRN